MSIFLFFVVLAILVLSHEFGHFVVAKKNGIRVDEFGFGFPPRLFKFKKGETVYSFNLIPFGGFVKILGEEGENADDPRSFGFKSVGARAAVVAAGVIFNLILAWVLFSFSLTIGMPASSDAFSQPKEISDIKISIISVAKDSPAQIAGLQPGDEILGFAKVDDIKNFIDQGRGGEIELKYRREGKDFSIKIAPRENPPSGQGATGIVMDEIGLVRLVWYQAIWEGLKMTYQISISVAISIFNFIVDAIRGVAGFDGIMGPVGIVGITGTAAKMGFSYLLNFTAFLSINLAVINILPFPALDGGRLIFLLIEKIKGSPINPKFSGIIHSAGLALLLILMFFITYRDIMKLL